MYISDDFGTVWTTFWTKQQFSRTRPLSEFKVLIMKELEKIMKNFQEKLKTMDFGQF